MRRFAVPCLFLLLVLLISAPRFVYAEAEEQNATDTTPGGGSEKPLVPGLPTTERLGNDLIIHYKAGDAGVTLPDYLDGITGTDTKTVVLLVDGHGRCVIAINAIGRIARATCDQ